MQNLKPLSLKLLSRKPFSRLLVQALSLSMAALALGYSATSFADEQRDRDNRGSRIEGSAPSRPGAITSNNANRNIDGGRRENRPTDYQRDGNRWDQRSEHRADSDRRENSPRIDVVRSEHRAFEHRHYPSRGVVINTLPIERRVVVHGGNHFFFSSGVWYRPYGPRFIVTAPPFGIVIPLLPPFYDVRVIRGTTYYVADDVYYERDGWNQGYVVVKPPEETSAISESAEKMFIYPRDGQSKEKQEDDRYACHDWAMNQSNFDPTAPHGGVEISQFESRRSDYQRAMAACMDGRGYTVK